MTRSHLAGFALATFMISTPAFAQGWAEQRPAQFRYVDQGMANEVYRNQLGTSGAAAAASVAISGGAGAGGGGSLQGSEQLNNVIQLNPTNTGSGEIYLNVTVTGTTQTTTDSSQNSTNQSQSQTLKKGGSAQILNQ
jgi:hypothetical protein